MTTLETTTAALAMDLHTVLNHFGQRVRSADDHTAPPGGVVLHHYPDHILVDWELTDHHGHAEGHTVHTSSVSTVLTCIRSLLRLHAPRHSWTVDHNPDPYDGRPIRVQWDEVNE